MGIFKSRPRNPRRIVAAEVRDDYAVWVEFADGSKGILDLSEFRAEGGSFTSWDDRAFFESMKLEGGSLAWGETIDFCPNLLYMRLTGCSFEDIYGMTEEALAAKVNGVAVS